MKPCYNHVSKTLAPLSVFLTTLLCLHTVLEAQQEAPGRAQLGSPRETRPAAPANGEVTIRKELLDILRNWEKAGGITKNLEGKHSRFTYDPVYSVVKYSVGEFYYEAPDRGRIDLGAPKNFREGATTNVNGKVYTFKTERPERWVCDGTQVVHIDEERKEFQKTMIPLEHRGRNIENGPLPFVFGISVEKMVARYNIILHDNPAQNGQHNLENNRIHLKVRPLWEVDAASWQEAEVLLTADSYLPQALRLIHPGGAGETVYAFTDVKRNSSRGVFSLWRGNPFEPRLNDYQELTPTAMEPRERR